MTNWPRMDDGDSFDKLIESVCSAEEPVVIERSDGKAVVLMTEVAYRDLIEGSSGTE